MFHAETGAEPAARVFHPQHLLCASPQLQGDQLDQAMTALPRFVLRANPNFGMVCEKSERLAAPVLINGEP